MIDQTGINYLSRGCPENMLNQNKLNCLKFGLILTNKFFLKVYGIFKDIQEGFKEVNFGLPYRGCPKNAL